MPSARPRPLHFAAFALSAAGRPVEGAWQLALPRQADFDDLEHWVRLARTLERGRFDAVFLADAVAHHSPRRGGYRPFEDGFRARGHDPSVLAGAIAYVTDHLGIGFTASSLHEHPSDFARRISALDDASNGRVAWNIPADDPPSPSAEEYLEVTYKLWEGSGDEDALRGGGRVHPINHRGAQYTVEGPHLASPTPQRTPRACTSSSAAPRPRPDGRRPSWTSGPPTPPGCRSTPAPGLRAPRADRRRARPLAGRRDRRNQPRQRRRLGAVRGVRRARRPDPAGPGPDAA